MQNYKYNLLYSLFSNTKILISFFFQIQKIESIIHVTFLRKNNCLRSKLKYIFKGESRWNYNALKKNSWQVKKFDSNQIKIDGGQKFHAVLAQLTEDVLIGRERYAERTMKYRGSVDARLIGEKWKEEACCERQTTYWLKRTGTFSIWKDDSWSKNLMLRETIIKKTFLRFDLPCSIHRPYICIIRRPI